MRSGICVAAGGFGLVALLSGCVVVPLPPPGDEWHTVSPEELGSWGTELVRQRVGSSRRGIPTAHGVQPATGP